MDLIMSILAWWLAFGLCAYGMIKNCWRIYFLKRKLAKYGPEEECICFLFGFLGPIGFLWAILLIYLEKNMRFGFCLEMPKKLCENRKSGFKNHGQEFRINF